MQNQLKEAKAADASEDIKADTNQAAHGKASAKMENSKIHQKSSGYGAFDNATPRRRPQ